eukprot:Seg364.3 transcript_id=Seg364.3/GoldUCD/mRNA.D3Y31 product="CDGSH iron-sulfur domain-containing protein 3 mitochondrial" protein_id=Seg364.3/GoldUCD/D3Y31
MLHRFFRLGSLLKHVANRHLQRNGQIVPLTTLLQQRNQSSTDDRLTGKIAAKGPFEVELVQGKRYSWCRCGYSDKQPFCDGQHRKYQTGLSPLRFKAEETGTAFFCGCKQTYNPPYCDGTHTCDAVQNS